MTGISDLKMGCANRFTQGWAGNAIESLQVKVKQLKAVQDARAPLPEDVREMISLLRSDYFDRAADMLERLARERVIAVDDIVKAESANRRLQTELERIRAMEE